MVSPFSGIQSVIKSTFCRPTYRRLLFCLSHLDMMFMGAAGMPVGLINILAIDNFKKAIEIDSNRKV